MPVPEKKSSQQQQRQDSNSPHGTTSSDTNKKNTNDTALREFEEYRERQRNEVEVLKSIFMDEFREIKPVWGGVSITMSIHISVYLYR
jgi:hypothetical protein